MTQRKEIVLPPHLYDRIKASAGEHGGIGAGALFSGINRFEGVPLCVHGHAWGTCTRKLASPRYMEPELANYISIAENDFTLYRAGVRIYSRIPFDRWCELLNVKRGVESPVAQELETVDAA